MITEEEQLLRRKAENAVLNYRRIYDAYPAIVGIERNRLRSFQTAQLVFPEVQSVLPTVFDDGTGDFSLPSVRLEIVRFAPIRGKKISPDEVYLPHPKGNRKAASSAAIARLLRMVEMRRKRAEEVHHRYARYFINSVMMPCEYRIGPLLADNED